jgi:hypothetical protein
MDKLEENLLQIKDLLEKGMNNAGIGGPGAVKAGAVLPSINKMPKLGNVSIAGKVKIPGQASISKKNPINVAEQTHNKDIKDIKMKEAHANIVMQKSDEISIADNGQWSLNEEYLNKGKMMQGIKTAALGSALAIGAMAPQAKASSFDNQVNITPTTTIQNTASNTEGSAIKAPKILNNLEIEARDKYQARPNENTAKMPLNQIRMANKQIMSNYLNNVNDPGDSTRYEDSHDQFKKDFPHVALYPEPVAKSDEVSIIDNGQWFFNKSILPDPTKTMQRELESKHEKAEPEFSGVEHLEYLRHESHENGIRRKEGKNLQDANIKIAKRHIEGAKKAHKANNKDATKAYINAAKEALNVKKSLKERLDDIVETLDKSNYPGIYDQSDNAKRKAKNTGETTGIHSMDNVKSYGGSGPSAAAKEAKIMRAKSKKMPVKVFSPEEIAQINASVNKTEGRATAVPGVSEMGIEVRRSNPKSKSYSRIVSPEKHGQTAKDIAKENIKQTKEIKPKLP